MADLTFGESLQQLEGSAYNPWVRAIFAYVNVISLMRIARAWPGLTRIMNARVSAETRERFRTHLMFSKERVDKRMARKTDRPDIWTFVTKHSEIEGKGLRQISFIAMGHSLGMYLSPKQAGGCISRPSTLKM